MDRCEPPGRDDRWGHVGVHPQKQPGKFYVGVVLPVGRMTSEQMDGLAEIADRFGSGTIRLTVWQNLLISDIDEARRRRGQAGDRAARPRLGRVERPERPGRLHRQRRLQVRRPPTPSATR